MTLDHLRAAQEALDVAQEALHAATAGRDATVQSAYADGVPVPQIAATLGVHRQIVYRIIRRA
ncbi:helix-turn-helix domain-containing protein [Brachybacterium sp. FME24]|uniref:helix-turn-helix domain-containing protein n=1 Tax=Brachybacterium sp. FME24 TaxID=2742605 RepID=UPI00186854FB|nr:helix-turn-helix domain-containing protein [Brachybacterium sp. FME24]